MVLCYHHVKLNNPLMGTETQSLCLLYYFDQLQKVKLNNPLMGTETLCTTTHNYKRR